MGALEQLKLWKIYADHWCEHKPSQTIYYTDDDFLGVCEWLWENFDEASGLSFLPLEKPAYAQLPLEEITEEEFNRLSAEMPEIDWEAFKAYELKDTTAGSQELACTGNACDLP